MVECNLAKVEVAGSNPVSRSILQRRLPQVNGAFFAASAVASCIAARARYAPMREFQRPASVSITTSQHARRCFFPCATVMTGRHKRLP